MLFVNCIMSILLPIKTTIRYFQEVSGQTSDIRLTDKSIFLLDFVYCTNYTIKSIFNCLLHNYTKTVYYELLCYFTWCWKTFVWKTTWVLISQRYAALFFEFCSNENSIIMTVITAKNLLIAVHFNITLKRYWNHRTNWRN